MNPYKFTGPYAECYANRDMAMDPRHVFILHEILKGGAFKSALELGSWLGASSSAFVEAINAGSEMVATFCDVQLTESLWNVTRACKHTDRVRLTRDPSTHVLESDEDFDFVLVDANHDYDSVLAELKQLVPRQPRCVMAHDTNATEAGYVKAEGAALLKHVFQALPGYLCLEDRDYRKGEQTQRGLFFATTDPKLFELAKTTYAKWR